jgi:hypothetical protein
VFPNFHIIAEGSADPERRKRLRSPWVYSGYLRAQAEQSGIDSSLVLE